MKHGKSSSNGVIITLIICVTLVLLALIGNLNP